MGAWLSNLFMEFIYKKLLALGKSGVEWVMSWFKTKEVAKDNVKKDKEATDSGDLDAIAEAGEDLLNGNKR